MIIGSATLALSSTENMLFLGLSFISISTGLIKSNISSFIGRFYDQSKLSDSHRDFGFNVFYVGINLGMFSALSVASYIESSFGFAAAFYSNLAISIFMMSVLIIGSFILKKHIASVKLTLKKIVTTITIIIVYIALIFNLLKYPKIADFSIIVASLCCIIIMMVSAQNKYWKQVSAVLCFFILSVIYWTFYLQMYISVLLFINSSVNHVFLGITIENSQFLAVDAISILILGTFMGKLWLYFGNKGKAVHDIDKFSLGFIFLIFCFLSIYLGIHISAANEKVPAIYLIISYIFLAISELCLSAIGLSMVTKLAPPKFVSLYMGIWLVTLGIGGKLSGFLSQYIHISDNLIDSKSQMASGIIIFILIMLLTMICSLLIRKIIIKNTQPTIN